MNDSRPSVIHLVNHCRMGHGNVHAAVDLACAQASHGNNVFYASEGGYFEDLLTQYGVKCVYLKQRSANAFSVLRSLVTLIALIRRHDIQVVHAHMMSGAILGYLATRLTRAKLVTTVHNSFDDHSKIMKLGDRVVAVSNSDRDFLIGRGFRKEKVSVILNAPLGGARSTLVPHQDIPELPRPSITTVCGLHERKGVNDLIEAFRLVQEQVPSYLNIVGEGPDQTKLEDQAARTGVGDRIRFHGSLSSPDQVLRQSDIFVLASLAEPLGLVNIEARAAGCAVVATDVGGIPEALDSGRAGILVPPKDPNAMAETIVRLLQDPASLKDWRERAARDLERFHIDHFYSEYNKVYSMLL